MASVMATAPHPLVVAPGIATGLRSFEDARGRRAFSGRSRLDGRVVPDYASADNHLDQVETEQRWTGARACSEVADARKRLRAACDAESEQARDDSNDN